MEYRYGPGTPPNLDRAQDEGADCEEKWDWSRLSMNSLLYDLWQEWQQTQGHPDQSLELMLDGNTKELHLTQQELEMEEKRVALRLMSSAKERHQLVQPCPGSSTSQVDAKPLVHVAANRMAVWILVFPPVHGGRDIQIEQLEHALLEHSVVAGIEKDVLFQIVEEKIYFKLMPVALGEPPEAGKDGYIEEYFPRERARIQPEQNIGIADYLDHKYIQRIQKGDTICRVVQPQAGAAGFDVLGTRLHGTAGAPVVPLTGRNTVLTGDGQVVAGLDGYVLFGQDRFHVQPLLTVEGDVEENGHIHFDGDVSIQGDVQENAVIQAAGTVMVGGMVEGVVIEADGDVVIAAGVLGDDKAVIRAKGAIRAKYLENCVAYAGAQVEVDCIIGSYVYSDDRVSALNGRGTVIGGKITAAHRIEAKIIGSKAERETDLVLGEYPCMKEEYQELKQQLKSVQKEIGEVERQIKYLQRKESSGEQAIQLGKCRLRRATLGIQEERLNKRMGGLKTQCEDYKQCRVEADQVYPVTMVAIGSTHGSIQEQVAPCRIRMGDGRIVIG